MYYFLVDQPELNNYGDFANLHIDRNKCVAARVQNVDTPDVRQYQEQFKNISSPRICHAPRNQPLPFRPVKLPLLTEARENHALA
jgi:hypothetical protein